MADDTQGKHPRNSAVRYPESEMSDEERAELHNTPTNETGMLPKGHVAAQEQKGPPQSLQGLQTVNGQQFAVVISTGRTHADEAVAERILRENPPQPVIPAQDPTPLESGDKVPVDPVTGQVALRGGPSRVDNPFAPVVATDEGTVQTVPAAEGLGEVQAETEATASTPTVKERATGRTQTPRSNSSAEK